MDIENLFPNLKIALSTAADGTMLLPGGLITARERSNKEAFLKKQGSSLEAGILVKISYKNDDFTKYLQVGEADRGVGMSKPPGAIADGLSTSCPKLALFLPLADCVGAVIYDPVKKAVMLSHLGRHSIEQEGGIKSIGHMVDTYNSNPNDILIYLTPAANKEGYPLFNFNNNSLQEVVVEQLMRAGIKQDNIFADERDTVSDPAFFSHSAFLKGKKPEDGRHAVACCLI